MNIRLASLNDVEGIAQVHIESWKTTYNGLISNSYLSKLTLDRRIKNWIWTFNNLHEDEVIFIIEDNSGRVVGFINGGKSRESELDFSAELYALYLLKEVQGNGYGRLLFKKLIESLKEKKHESLMLWVLDQNPSINFYKKLGGQFIKKKEIQIGEEKLTEIAFGWREI